MDVAIGLPNAVPGTTGAQLVEWAHRADARGFSSLGTIDRIVYGNYEPLTALAAAAAVTERIGLSGRGRRLDAMLERIKEVWSEGEVGPTIEGAPSLIVGGHADASFARAARFADGWIAAGSGPDQCALGIEKTKAAWAEAGRDDEPRTMALAYFSLGERAEEEARAYLADYYAWLGEQIAEFLVAGAVEDADAVKQLVASYEATGCDELILFPSSGDPDQVDLLADAVGLRR